MSVDFDPSKQRWRVRWREDGKQRSRRFATEVEAIAFDQERSATPHSAAVPPTRVATATGDAIYRPLAEFLIGTGARISEAVAVRWADLDLEQAVVRIYRQRSRNATSTRATKGKGFRSVQMGPRLAQNLRGLRVSRLSHETADAGWTFLCPPPRRGRYAGRTEPVPPHRKTAHEWHEAALADAGLRDMPLHSLRHTAAAAWLAAGHPLIFVQRQRPSLDHHDGGALRASRGLVRQERGRQDGRNDPGRSANRPADRSPS